jgi:hypothetical protein
MPFTLTKEKYLRLMEIKRMKDNIKKIIF